MNGSTDRLIAALAADAKPVRRLASPLVRASVWLLVFGTVAATALVLMSNVAATFGRMVADHQILAAVGEVATGVVSVVAACHLALPDRSRRWALLPLPFLALWLAASGYGCLEVLSASGSVGPDKDSPGCFVFMIAVSLPTAGLLFLMLRKARPLKEKLTALVAAMGVAALSAFLLRFFHPFEITVIDLAFHLAGAAVVVGVAALVSPRALGLTL